MIFTIDPKIFAQFPGLRVGVIVAHNVTNGDKNPPVYALFDEAQQLIQKSITSDALKKHPYIEAWHNAYTSFGAKPKEHKVSVENMMHRILKGESLAHINPLVSLYNTLSLRYMIPAGGDDLSSLKGSLRVTFADGTEKPAKLLGEKEARSPEKGEVIYLDDEGIVCRRFNWKQAERTKITENTSDVILVFEALSVVPDEQLQSLLNEGAHIINTLFNGAHATVSILDEKHPTITLKEGNSWKNLSEFDAGKITAPSCFNLEMPDETISLEHEARVQKVQDLRTQGIEPWPSLKEVTTTCKELHTNFVENDTHSYAVAGRVIGKREHGKTMFMTVQDRTGITQVYLKADTLGADAFNFAKHMLDLGDIVWYKGTTFKTKTGEVTLAVQEFALQSKCLHPMPEKFHGVTDIETKYRQRYLDLMTNDDTRERFKRRSTIIKSIRHYLDTHDFVEVETPMLHPIPGGAAARPFVTHHNALNSELFLRIAPELYLKRLVVGGFERVYEINRNFRNEGVSTRHNPEFTMLEFYWAFKDYHFVMTFIEDMIKKSVQETTGGTTVPYGNHELDFGKPFRRLTAKQAILETKIVSERDLSPEEIDITCRRYNITILPGVSYAQKMFALFEEVAESHIIQPTFIVDFPVEISPLAKRDVNNPAIAARFELYVAGMELSNGFNELNDPFDQAERFKEQAHARTAGDAEAMYYDAEFIQALEYGLPPTVGVGIGIDRLVMLLTNTTSIKEVILFPTLKRKQQ
jgi:lysyl-tRNA synthetase class 2